MAESTYRIQSHTIEAKGDGVFVVTPPPLKPELLALFKEKGSPDVLELLEMIQTSFTLKGESLREWTGSFGSTLGREVFKDLCSFLNLDPDSFDYFGNASP